MEPECSLPQSHVPDTFPYSEPALSGPCPQIPLPEDRLCIVCNCMDLLLHVACMGEERGVYRFLVGKLEGKRPLGRPRRRWVDNIRMDLQEVGCGYMDCIGLAQDTDSWRTLVSAVMNLRVA